MKGQVRAKVFKSLSETSEKAFMLGAEYVQKA